MTLQRGPGRVRAATEPLLDNKSEASIIATIGSGTTIPMVTP
jgi:hypothetical protein